jgi:hypothetical protein
VKEETGEGKGRGRGGVSESRGEKEVTEEKIRKGLCEKGFGKRRECCVCSEREKGVMREW